MYKTYGRYQKARNAAWRIILDFNINSLPVDILGLINQLDITVLLNSDVNMLEPLEMAISIFAEGKCYIIYDDTLPYEVVRFTLAHELGHIVLGHNLIESIDERILISELIPKAEREADTFASRLLAPACVLGGLGIKNYEDIARLCEISLPAAKVRAKRMEELYKRNKFLTSLQEKKVYAQFEEFTTNFTKKS